MPFYVYRCPNQHRFELFLTVADHVETWACLECPERAQQVITAPVMVTAAPDVCYDSPIDGRPITSWQARQEDLKRHQCSPYDPEQKTDAARRRTEHEAALDQSVETFVERTIEQMPTAQRGRLYSEVTEQGTDLTIERTTR